MDLTYTQNIPYASNNPSVDQPNMQTNTNSIASIIGVDHFGFGNANGGYHQQVTFPVAQGMDPSLSVGGEIYTKLVSEVPQLFYAFYNGSGTTVQSLSESGKELASNGGIDLSGGIKIRWGNFVLSSFGKTISYATGGTLSSLTTTYSVVGVPQIASPQPYPLGVSTFTSTGFTASASTLGQTYFYIAIGS